MTIKNDKWIIESCKKGMIEPYELWQVKERPLLELNGLNEVVKKQFKEKVISYGPSSYGYDIRCFNQFKIFTNTQCPIVDPKNFTDDNFTEITANTCIIPPNSFVLTRSLEYFRIPRNILCVCLGKSTYARCGIIVNVTPLEPEWEGYLTIEISNTTPNPVKVYSLEGIAQLLFYEADEECEISYKDKKGKYNKQVGITGPKV